MNKKPSTLKALFGSKWSAMLVAGIFIAAIILPLLMMHGAQPASAEPSTTNYADSANPNRAVPGTTNAADSVANVDSVEVPVIAISDEETPAATNPEPSKSIIQTATEREWAARRERIESLNKILTKTYSYTSPSKIPSELPMDCETLKFSLQGVNQGGEPQVLAGFTHPAVGFRFVIVENPDLGEVSIKNQQAGYGLIAVFCQNEDADKAELTVMSYNSVENPEVTVCISPYDSVASARMDVAVFHFGLFSRTHLHGNVYRSDGTNESNFDWWGSASSGDKNYEFSPTSVKVAEGAEHTHRLDCCDDNITDYQTYWEENSSKVAKLKSYFSEDRATFDLDGYAAYLGYSCTAKNDRYRVYSAGGRKITISTSLEPTVGSTTSIKVNDEKVQYSGTYTARVDHLPDIVRASGNIFLHGSPYEELDIVLRFLEWPDNRP